MDDWINRFRSIQFYFNITEENNKFKLYKFPDGKAGAIKYEKVRDDIERDLDISDIRAADLQDDLIAPIIIEEYKEQVRKTMKDVGYMNIVAGYVSSVFQDFECYLRTEVELFEDDVRLVLGEYNSRFITFEISPGIYTFKDISEALFNILQPESPEPSNTIVTEFDDITRKTKLVVRSGMVAIGFDEKSFFSTILGFTPGWDYKHYNKYISQKIVNLINTNIIYLKYDCIDGSIQNGSRQPFLFSFVLDKAAGNKVFCEPGTIHYKKINNSVLNTITFYLGDNNNEKVDFN